MKNDRQAKILELLYQKQSVQVKELRALFGVSDETIRRDFLALEEQGLLRCVRGGAVYDSPTSREYHVNLRIQQNQQEKEAVCREAAELVKNGDSIAIAASTTALPLGEHLVQKDCLTVITNSVCLANQIANNTTNTVHLVGGIFWKKDQKNMGARAVEMFRQFRVDKAFFSVAGISQDKGIMEYTETEQELTRAVMDCARQRILLTDFSKFDVMALCKIAEMQQIDHIVTDWHLGIKELRPYQAMGIQIHRAQRKF